jgi:hypothetical protein
MKKFRNLLKLSMAVVSLLLAGAAAKADPFTITLTLASGFQSGRPGDILEFDATATNNNSSYVYLNSDSPTLAGSVLSPTTPPGLYLDDTAFLTTFALDPSNGGNFDLPPGGSFTGELFTVEILPDTPLGSYTGQFAILGGGDTSDTTDVIGSANFDVEVTPEPPTWELMALALLALFGMKSCCTYRRQTAA